MQRMVEAMVPAAHRDTRRVGMGERGRQKQPQEEQRLLKVYSHKALAGVEVKGAYSLAPLIGPFKSSSL